MSDEDKVLAKRLYSRNVTGAAICSFVLPLFTISFPAWQIIYQRYILKDLMSPYPEQIMFLGIFGGFAFLSFMFMRLVLNRFYAVIAAEQKRFSRGIVISAIFSPVIIRLDSGKIQNIKKGYFPIINLRKGDRVALEEIISGSKPFTDAPYYDVLRFHRESR